MILKRSLKIISLCLILCIVGSSVVRVYADDEDKIEDLKQSIAEKNAQIEKINKEIKALDAQVQTTAAQGQTLKTALATLEASRNKLLKEIQATQGKVSAASLSINKLDLEIKNKQQEISTNKDVLGETIRQMNQAEDSPLIENILAYETMADVWNEIESLSRFQTGLREKIAESQALTEQLSGKKAENESVKKSLIDFQTQLDDQKKIVDQNKAEKDKLLTETQNQEAAYRKQLNEKKSLADAFQQEINNYESQLKLIIDPRSYPSAGSSVLNWPLANVIITQQFGDTAFAKSGAYNGNGHNGVDFGASTGSTVLSALSGTVAGTGNTDKISKNSRVTVIFSPANIRNSPNGTITGTAAYGALGTVSEGPTLDGNNTWWKIDFDNRKSGWVAESAMRSTCYSYGKWILIKHDNGLSSMYAHLSLIKATEGDRVSTGDIIGYSGNTGYSTGPHLHFGVYASQGVKIVQYTNSINCKNAVIPVADLKAYLDPMDYLPKP